MSFSFASMSKFSATIAIAAAIGLPATFAAAGTPPAVEFQFSVNGEDPLTFNPDGTNVGGMIYNYQGQQLGGDWSLDYDINAEADPFISGNIVVTNFGFATQTFSLTIILPVTPITPSTLIGGSVAGGITADGSGGTLSSITPNSSIWSALIDGNTVASLLTGGSATAGAFQSASIGPASFGAPIPSMVGPAINNTMAINISFALTAGDSASFTSVFVAQVPAPAGLAIFGLVGFAGRRRRRA
ncbi:MAG: hypothetical protein KDA22_16820 [Phycisphaerales bacterium]|nr:hypothetical protein [Phycisphaerales bacterium]